MGETIDDALATRCTVPVSLEPFEGEGRTGTVAQEPFEPCTVTARDMDRGIDAEPARVGAGAAPADTRPASSQEGGGWGQAPREPDVLVLGSRRTPRRGIWEAQGWAAGPGPRTAAPRRSVTAAPPPCQGVNRFINRGNGIISRT